MNTQKQIFIRSVEFSRKSGKDKELVQYLGYSVSPQRQGSYCLRCIYKPIKVKEGNEELNYYPVWYEYVSKNGNILWRSEPVAFFRDEAQAGSAAWRRTLKNLSSELSDHLEGKINLRDKIRKD